MGGVLISSIGGVLGFMDYGLGVVSLRWRGNRRKLRYLLRWDCILEGIGTEGLLTAEGYENETYELKR